MQSIIRSLVVDASSSGDNTLLAATSTQTIRVLEYHLVAGGSVTATFKSGSNAITGPMPMINGVPNDCPGLALPVNRPCLFECAKGQNLVLNLSGATAVGGHLVYEAITP